MVLDQTLPVLLIILLLGVIVPEVFRMMRLPFIGALIIMGSLLGPNGGNLIYGDTILEFFAFLGGAFLMLLAGLEAKLSVLRHSKKQITKLSLINGAIPFIMGTLVIKLLGYPWHTAIMVGVIFISSSVAIVASTLHHTGLIKKKVGKLILSTTVLEDVVSLLLLAILIQTTDKITPIPLPLYFAVLFVSLIALKVAIPTIADYFFKQRTKNQYERETRIVLVILLSVLLYFSGIGVHPIVAAFFVGMLLSDVVKDHRIYQKFHTIGYGIFVPVFFFIVGMELRIGVLLTFNLAVIAVVITSILSKLVSGYFAARSLGMQKKTSQIFAIATTPQLTTTLAVTYVGLTYGILDEIIVTSILTLSIVTTIVSPLAINWLYEKYDVKPVPNNTQVVQK